MRLVFFPFWEPVLPVLQQDLSRKRVFVLGVYASAVHAWRVTKAPEMLRAEFSDDG